MIRMERLRIGSPFGDPDANAKWKTWDFEPYMFRLEYDKPISRELGDDALEALLEIDGIWSASVGKYACRISVCHWVTDIFAAASACRPVIEKFIKKSKKKKAKCKKNAATSKTTKGKGNRAANA